HCFFFQAEDGIRGRNVTGVQTCALPISDAKEKGEKIAKDYRIKRIFTSKDLWVEIDTDKMTQVIDNIMNNAIKYSPDGGVITCRSEERRVGKECRLRSARG